MKATFLGTGCAMVLKRYNTCFLLEEDTSKLLVDAGGGSEILIRLDKLGIPVTALGGMFVTHSHSDHILGTPWVIRAVATAMAEEGYTGTFTVAACQRTLSDIRTICEMILGKKLTKFFDSQILFRQVTDGEALDLAGFHITAFDIGSKKMQQFGFLLDAFKYGVPPHAGLAYGLDRLVMLMAQEDSIRDVIAFPKVKDASCLMSEAPNTVDAKQLEELGIAIAKPEAETEE